MMNELVLSGLQGGAGTGSSSLTSCDNRCGNYNPQASCQCDSYCSLPQYNDCCSDLNQYCKPALTGSAVKKVGVKK